MRVMVFVKATEDSETGVIDARHADMFVAMGKYNEELVKAGIMLGGPGRRTPRACRPSTA